MNLSALFSILAFLAALVAVWAALRTQPEDSLGLEALNRHLGEEMNQQRRDIQADLAVQLKPLNEAVAKLSEEAAVGREATLAHQAKQLTERFEALTSAIQNALKEGRLEQGNQLQKVQDQVQVTVGQAIVPSLPIHISPSNSWKETTWRGGVEYDVTPASLLYATVETGFKAGGFFFSHDAPVYQPEKITAYSVGSKNRFLDNRLQLNAEVYYWL